MSAAGLTEGKEDDVAAAGGLVGFWERVFGRAQVSGRSAFIKEAADSLRGARETLAGLTASPELSSRPPSPEEIARAAAEQVATLNEAVMSARSQYGSNVVINNRFAAPPPEPHVWAESQRFAAQTAFG